MNYSAIFTVMDEQIHGITASDIADKNGVISEQRLMQILGASGVKTPVKYVPKPKTQVNHLCPAGSNTDQQLMAISNAVRAMLKTDRTLHAIAEVQLLYGLRISEVLNIHGKDIMLNGHVKIHGLKHSHDRIIIPVESLYYYKSFSGKPCLVFDGHTRFSVYKQYKKRNISMQLPGTNRMAVTHCFRHLLARNFKRSNIPTDDTQRFIGHKARKNTEIYEGTRD